MTKIIIFLIDLYWSIIASQYFVSFCCEQSESAICIHISPYHLPLEPPSHLPYPTSLGHAKYRADLPVLCCCFPLANYFTFGSVYMSMLLLTSPQLPPPTSFPQVHSLRLRLYSCPAARFFRTTFFFFSDSIYMC